MTTNYDRGRAVEYKVIDCLEKAGYTAIRTAGSHGPFDVIAWSPVSIRFIQCKRTKTEKNFDVEIEQIKGITVPVNCTRELWVWQDGKGWLAQHVF